jgi:hypothetical protein
MSKKPYIKKFGKISEFKIWIVDGNYVRKHIDEEFTNFGQHYRFPFIPKNEFWIDKDHGEPEEKYYIEHMLVENELMAAGKNYNTASDKANKIERKERKKSKLIQRLESLKEKKHHLVIKRIHKKLLTQFSKKIQVWLVNGKLVRDIFFIDFTAGGHDKVYPFVPENEIWIDDSISPQERKYVLLHEAHERFLMSKGTDYGRAHMSSSEIEHFCRMNSSKLNSKLKEELSKNNSIID